MGSQPPGIEWSRDVMMSVARLMMSARWCCRHPYLRCEKRTKTVKRIQKKI